MHDRNTSLRKTRLVRMMALVLAAALGLAGLTTVGGCQQNKQRDQWSEDANNRWLSLRSNMMLGMAHQQFETGDLDMAERTLNDAMEIDPANAKLHVLAGRIAMEKGRLERSYHMFGAAQELNDEEAEAFYYQGVVLQRWQRYDAAEQAYRRAYELRSDHPGYLLAISEMLVEQGELDEARSILEARLDYFDQSAALRAQIGYLYRLQNRPDKAAPFFEEAALMNPDNLKLRAELGMAQFAAGDTRDAIATLEELLEDPQMRDRRDLRRTLARSYVEVGQLSKARRIYLSLARGERGEVSDWLRLAQLSWRAEDLGATLQAAGQVIERAPDRYEGYLLAGMVWHKRGRTEEALSMFDRAAARAADRTEPLIMRGLSLQGAGRIVAARRAYRDALDIDPEDRRAQRLLNALDSAAAATP